MDQVIIIDNRDWLMHPVHIHYVHMYVCKKRIPIVWSVTDYPIRHISVSHHAPQRHTTPPAISQADNQVLSGLSTPNNNTNIGGANCVM